MLRRHRILRKRRKRTLRRKRTQRNSPKTNADSSPKQSTTPTRKVRIANGNPKKRRLRQKRRSNDEAKRRRKQIRAKIKREKKHECRYRSLVNLACCQETQHHDKRTKLDCGFTADPTLPTQKNVIHQLGKTAIGELFNNCINCSCHNLCKKHHVPPAAMRLSGSGLKFCIVDCPAPRDLSDIDLDRFVRDVHAPNSSSKMMKKKLEAATPRFTSKTKIGIPIQPQQKSKGPCKRSNAV